MRDAMQIMLIKTNPHSPGQFRANGTVKNKPGDKMYLAPKDRVIIW